MRLFKVLKRQIKRSGGGKMRPTQNKKYSELLELIRSGENVVWLRNKIYLNYENDYITFNQREELLKELENR